MVRSRKRLLMLVGALPVLILLTALVYMAGMALLEKDGRSLWDSLAWAAETLSTTGYGADSRWEHPAMVLFVIVVQFAGVFLIFLIFPIYLIPFLEERFETRLPTELEPISGHVVIYRYGPAVQSLLGELERFSVPVVLLEEDPAVARRLFDQGHRVLLRGIEDDSLAHAHLDRARCLITNGPDDVDTALILAARQEGYRGEILALVDEPAHRRPIQLAGATAAFTPNHVLADVLAARASRRVGPAISGTQTLGRHLQVAEVRVGEHSELVGRSLEEAEIGQRTGVTVVGRWIRGRLDTTIEPTTRLTAGSLLIVVGRPEDIGRMGDVCRGATPLPTEGLFVVAGRGEVGRKVEQLLTDAGERVLTIDRVASEGTDVVGDVLDPSVLMATPVAEARAVVLALDTDSATLFATVVLKDLVPDVPIIARVNRAENVERIHRAGAESASSISQVAGQILARRILGEEAVSLDPRLELRQVGAEGLVGRHPTSAGVRERTGCSIVAVEREDEVFTAFDDDFVIAAGDRLTICGSGTATSRFLEVYGS